MKVYVWWDGREVVAHEEWEATRYVSFWLFACRRGGRTSFAVAYYGDAVGWGYWYGMTYYPVAEITARLLLQGTPGEAREWARGRQR